MVIIEDTMANLANDSIAQTALLIAAIAEVPEWFLNFPGL